MRISEYDVVRVIADIPENRVDRSTSQRLPQIGDLGTIVLAHHVQTSQEAAFVVECVGAHGQTIWLADIFASELERAPAESGGA
jgi:hypothetical protein